MSEYVKDPTKPTGWKTVSHSKRSTRNDGAPVTAEGMDEGAEDMGDGDEAPEGQNIKARL